MHLTDCKRYYFISACYINFVFIVTFAMLRYALLAKLVEWMRYAYVVCMCVTVTVELKLYT